MEDGILFVRFDMPTQALDFQRRHIGHVFVSEYGEATWYRAKCGNNNGFTSSSIMTHPTTTGVGGILNPTCLDMGALSRLKALDQYRLLAGERCHP